MQTDIGTHIKAQGKRGREATDCTYKSVHDYETRDNEGVGIVSVCKPQRKEAEEFQTSQ